jgi:hypothetical protein
VMFDRIGRAWARGQAWAGVGRRGGVGDRSRSARRARVQLESGSALFSEGFLGRRSFGGFGRPFQRNRGRVEEGVLRATSTGTARRGLVRDQMARMPALGGRPGRRAAGGSERCRSCWRQVGRVQSLPWDAAVRGRRHWLHDLNVNCAGRVADPIAPEHAELRPAGRLARCTGRVLGVEVGRMHRLGLVARPGGGSSPGCRLRLLAPCIE